MKHVEVDSFCIAGRVKLHCEEALLNDRFFFCMGLQLSHSRLFKILHFRCHSSMSLYRLIYCDVEFAAE